MSFDAQALGGLAARVMEQLEDTYGETDTLLTVGIVVEVEREDTTEFQWAVNDPRAWFAAAFFKEASISAEDRIETNRDAEE